jgi:hypothetical protein
MAIEQPLHTNYEKPRYTEPLSITLAPRRCSAASQLSRGVLQIFSLIAAATAKVIVHTHTPDAETRTRDFIACMSQVPY